MYLEVIYNRTNSAQISKSGPAFTVPSLGTCLINGITVD